MADCGGESVAQRAFELADHAAMAARLARDLPAYLRTPLTLEAARRHVIAGLEHRERRFLDLVERTIYGHTRSPYRRLLEHAGCEPGDLATLVAHEGLEGALRVLADQGVYVTYDELKGRRPAVRGSACFTFSERDFDSPLCRNNHCLVYTGGSSGNPSAVRRTLDSVTDAAAVLGLALEAHGVRAPRTILWTGGSPTQPLVPLKLGNSVDRWFYPIHPLPPVVRAGYRYMTLLARLAGRRLPPPVRCDLNEPEPIARLLAAQARAERPIVVNTGTSSALRVASAAAAMGQSLPGVTFHCRGEPLSASRRRLIEDVGAGILVEYSSNELPVVAYGCPDAAEPDDVHLWLHLYAAVRRERPLFQDGPTVDGLLLTTLTPTAGKIGLNAELGDSARVEERDCGCPIGALGLRTHLSEIRSFEKLSSEGTTFARSNLIQILDEVLPTQFGGTSLDYQLVEEETADGTTALVLMVHPRVGLLDEGAARGTLLRELARGGIVDAYHARLLERAQSVVIRRLPPMATGAGKVLPYHLVRTGRRE